jgi:hypothetical protein
MSDHVLMITLLLIAASVAALGAFGALSLKFGVDSRPGFDERPYRF